LDLIKYKENLPVNIEELRDFILVGKERLKAHQAKVRAIQSVTTAGSARRLALADAQDVAEIVINAELRLGELLKALPKPKFDSTTDGCLKGTIGTLPPGIDKRLSHQAQTLANNPEAVSEIVEMARKEDKIPTPDMTYKTIKRTEALLKTAKLRGQKVLTPEGKYDVVVVDPPWPMEKIERDVRPNQHAFDYPTMNENELSELKIPASEDCHLFLWTTQRFLPMALRLAEHWGFRYVCLFTWHKPGGYQPFGLPQYNSEFVVYARKGTPKFIDTKDFMTCFSAPRGTHSEKPESFYQTIARTTGDCRRIDMFARRQIPNFTAWGNEIDETMGTG